MNNLQAERQFAERIDFYGRLGQKCVAPLWESLDDLVPVQPRPAAVAMRWSYDEIRPLLVEAGEAITAKEAERRVLMLENPGLRGKGLIADSLYAGIQLVLPREIARTHRHSATALRFILEGSGGYTSVNGERTSMRPGDFILTPSWTFHDHGNFSNEPLIWLDGLDVPIVNLLNAAFSEASVHETQPAVRPEKDSLHRYGMNMTPLEYKAGSISSPVLTYPYERSREALEWMSRNSPCDPCHGFKMQYVNPVTGGYPTPTIAAFLQVLPAAFKGMKYRSTDATIFAVAEGCGSSTMGRTVFPWKQRDIFVVPSWCTVEHTCESKSVLFSFSDRPVQKALGLWREEALLAG